MKEFSSLTQNTPMLTLFIQLISDRDLVNLAFTKSRKNFNNKKY